MRVLLIEDSQDAAKDVIRSLERQGGHRRERHVVTRVKNPADVASLDLWNESRGRNEGNDREKGNEDDSAGHLEDEAPIFLLGLARERQRQLCAIDELTTSYPTTPLVVVTDEELQNGESSLSGAGDSGEGASGAFEGSAFRRGVQDVVLRSELDTVDLRRILRHAAERKAFELELRKAKERAEDANQMKNAFLSNVSHAIRQPLAVIMGYAELIGLNCAEQAVGTSEARSIYESGENLLRLVDDVVELSSIESGQVEPVRVPCNPAALLDQVVDFFSSKYALKGVKLFSQRESGIGDFASDPTRIRQVLIQLLGNALKFTRQGNVNLTLSANEGFVTFTVKDSGVGISEEQQSAIFAPFHRGPNARGQRGGVGIGLSISRQVARLLGGDLTVESVEGEGSEFTFSVARYPIDMKQLRGAPDEEARAPSAVAGNSLGGRVLLVDDMPSVSETMRRLLEGNFSEIDCVESGVEALDLCQRNQYDLILLDLLMPGMSGFEVFQSLKERGVEAPVIALTGQSKHVDEKQTLEAGFDGFLSKPVPQHVLLSTVALVLEKSRRS
ncbi:MAG: response regulator [Planctomycetota bacterium]